MANQIALKLHSRPGDVLVADRYAHVVIYEYGGAAAHAGLMIAALDGRDGRFTVEQLEAVTITEYEVGRPAAPVLAVENTHNSSGGRCWPIDELEAVTAAARERGLATHLDGARLLNAAVATGVPAARIGGLFDTVTLCLSKGLGCPLGALLAGSEEAIGRAWREKHLFGGAMRQAGIVAAAGVYALDHHVDRLADDHARARRLAEGWHAAGLPIDFDAGPDELRPTRRRRARPRARRGARALREAAWALVDDPPDDRPRRDAPRPRRRRHRASDRVAPRALGSGFGLTAREGSPVGAEEGGGSSARRVIWARPPTSSATRRQRTAWLDQGGREWERDGERGVCDP